MPKNYLLKAIFRYRVISEFQNIDCVKYRNFTLFHAAEILWKGSVSAKFPHHKLGEIAVFYAVNFVKPKMNNMKNMKNEVYYANI